MDTEHSDWTLALRPDLYQTNDELASRQTAPTQTDDSAGPPLFGLPSARDAFQGIQPYFLVTSLPAEVSVITTMLFVRGPYLFAPHVRRQNDNPSEIVYYIVHRRDQNRNEYVVGPTHVHSFLANLETHSLQGAMTHLNGIPNEYEAEAIRMGQQVREGNFLQALKSLGRSWKHAFKDPGFWLNVTPAGRAGRLLTTGVKGAPRTATNGLTRTILKGGGKTARKKSRDALENARERVAQARAHRDILRAKANKTKTDKAELKKAEKALKKAEEQLKASENHAQRSQGPTKQR